MDFLIFDDIFVYAKRYSLIHTQIMQKSLKNDEWRRIVIPGIRHLIVRILALRIAIENNETYEQSKDLTLNGQIELELKTDLSEVRI